MKINNHQQLAENLAFNIDIYTQTIGWTIPDAQTIYTLSACLANKRVMSVYAGSGYLENILTAKSKEVLHTTVDQEKVVLHKHTGKTFVNLINVEALEAVRRYKTYDTLLMIMPPCYDTQAIECINEFVGDTIVLICTEEFIQNNAYIKYDTSLKVRDVPTKTLVAEEPFEQVIIKIIHKI